METNYDRLVIELQKENKSVVSIAVDKKDIDTMKNLHGMSMSEIITDMVKTMEDGINERASK